MARNDNPSHLAPKKWAAAWVDVIRVVLGALLLWRGIDFIVHLSGLAVSIEGFRIGMDGVVIAHLVILAHLGGGVLLLVGLVTRAAAALQLPILVGALIFVDFAQGYFADLSMAYTIFVLAMAIVATVFGSGRFSVDHAIARRAEHDRPLTAA